MNENNLIVIERWRREPSDPAEVQVEHDVVVGSCVDLYPSFRLRAWCPTAEYMPIYFALAHGVLSVEIDHDEVHALITSYPQRVSGLRAYRDYSARIQADTAHKRFKSVADLISWLDTTRYAPRWYETW
jgi:hypothetical protein